MIIYRKLKENELEKWFDFAALVYGDGDEQETKKIRIESERNWHSLIYKEQSVVFIACDNDIIVSAVHLFFRESFYLNNIITVGCIGGVATLSEYRKQGIATKLLEMAIHEMESRRYCVSMLGAYSNVRSVYSKLGWQCSVKNNKWIKVIGKPNSDYSFSKLYDERGIEYIAKIYVDFSSRYNGAFVRHSDKALWENLYENNSVYKVMNGSKNIVAYFVVDEMTENSFSILEYGCLNEYIDSFDSIIEAFCATLGNNTYTIEFSGDMKTSYQIAEQDQYWGYMYRLISPFYAGSTGINTTEDFIYNLHGIDETDINKICDSRSLFWYTDNF